MEASTEEKKESLLGKGRGKAAYFVRAVQEIVESYEKLKKQNDVDRIKVVKAHRGDTNSEESSPEVIVVDSSRFPLQISDHQSKCKNVKVKLGEEEPPLCRNVVGVAKNVDIVYRKTAEEQFIDDVKEARLLSTYSLRRRSGSSHLECSMTRKQAMSVRWPRGSSRLYSSKVESTTLLCKDVEKLVGISSSNSVIEGKGRSGSEVVSMDSDDRNEDSAVESGNKYGAFKIAFKQAEGEHVVGDYVPRKGLDMDIKAVVLKRNMKPNGKRLINDVIDPVPNSESELNLDTSRNAVAPDSAVAPGNCPGEDGDEHLPLVKHARMRMSKQSVAEAVCNHSEMEAQSPNQNLPNLPPSSCSSSDHGNDSSQLVCKEIPLDIPSSECYPQCSDVALQLGDDLKNPPSAGSVGSSDVEAALPPSKRLHRTLEAMSANFSEPCPSSEEAPFVVQMETSECYLSPVPPPLRGSLIVKTPMAWRRSCQVLLAVAVL